MAERIWTPAQKAAIEETHKTLLVSAAAGSGKTAILTERIIRALTDPQDPADITRMLIVTFTRAAAAELRDRIGRALREAGKGQRSPHIARQLLLLPGAHISTIDSFCLDLVRAHAARLGLSPSFRLTDPAENRLLLHSLMEQLINECYEGGTEVCSDAAFCALVDCLTDGRSDKNLSDLFLSLYDSTRGFARSYRVVADMAEELRAARDLPPFETPWGAFIKSKTEATLASAIALYRDHIAALNEEYAADMKVYGASLPVFEEELRALSACRDALAQGYTAAREALLAFPALSLKGVKAEDKTPVYEAACLLRTTFKTKTLKKLLTDYYAYTEEEWHEMMPRLAELVATLGQLLICFGERAEAEKRRRSICDFGDLEHYALRLLTEQDGRPSALAREVQGDFDWVYIDEYQDVNEVQHRIFEAVSGPRNRFMVGDVKQSIYSFRGAQPEIFARVRGAYPPLDEAGESETASVSLSNNFRSTPAVLDFVNRVFGRLMEAVGAHIGYTEDDRLIPGSEKEHGPRVTLALFDKKTSEAEEAEEHTEASDGDGEEGEGESPDREARWVAARIAKLLREEKKQDGTPIRPGDIAILTRKVAAGARFARALEEQGIASDLSAKNGFFLHPEILLALSLLNVIDNPRRDIYLAGLLRSPLFDFSLDDLVRIRRAAESDPTRRGCTLYEALCYYTEEHPEFTRGRDFLSRLAAYRALAESRSVDRLIRHLYRETGLLSLAGADKSGSPESRRANLMLLYDYARRFESSSFRGLYNFIAYINEAIERGQSIEERKNTVEQADKVHIMTIHQSKGLEFPVCFVADCGTQFNRRDTVAPLLFDRHYGCAMRLRDESGLARVRTPVGNVIAHAIGDRATEEEMRVLYVALTRAKERLFVTATLRDIVAKEETARMRAQCFGEQEALSCASYAEMLLATLGDDESFDTLIPQDDEKGDPCVAKTEETEETAAKTVEDETEQALHALFTGRFSYVYPHAHLTALPSKLSVSALYPTVLDGTEGESLPLAAWPSAEPSAEQTAASEKPAAPRAPLPLFLGGERNTAAEAGTATHLFMQFCDLAHLREVGGEAELARLRACGFLTAEDAALVRLDEIERFRRSPLLAELLGRGRLFRELRFNVRLPAAAFTADPTRRAAYAAETLLVQGVMDGIFEHEDGALHLFDYKTDRLSAAERRDPARAATRLLARHRTQLIYYAAACRRIFGRLPARLSIYSLALGDTVDLPFTPDEIP